MLRYAITDGALSDGGGKARHDRLVEIVEQWATSGIEFIQLREKDLPAGRLVALAREIKACLRSSGGPSKLLVNSRADVAVAVESDGVHLTSAVGSLTPDHVRRLYASAGLPEPVVSVSCHTLEEVKAASHAGATVILFGPVFEKRVGSRLVSAGTGLDMFRAACRAAATVPVLALGGVTNANTQVCIEAGAAGIAAIRLLTPGLTKIPLQE